MYDVDDVDGSEIRRSPVDMEKVVQVVFHQQ